MLFPRFAAALLLLTIGLVAPAHAQNNKQIISGTWYEDRASSSVNNNSTILLTFTQTPTNQFLNITNVACNVTMTSDQILSSLTLYAGTTSGAEDLGRPYSIMGSVNPQTLGFSKYYSIVTNQVFFKFGPGRYPTIEVDAPSTNQFSTIVNCVIVGNLTDN
jgi:hypothetical protein